MIDIENFLRQAKWNIISNLYGSTHNSIIGFISMAWLAQSNKNFVFDEAPAKNVGLRNKGKRADLLLCSDSKPTVIVEVESNIDKLEVVKSYLNNREEFSGLEFGLLLLLNYKGRSRDVFNWNELKASIKSSKTKYNIVLVSFIKGRGGPPLNSSLHRRLVENYHWCYNSIGFWINFKDQQTHEFEMTIS